MSLFVTFEGADGVGKSTIANLIYEELLKRNIEVIKTREPGGTRISETIRDIILNNSYREMDYRCEALLYAASRAQHVEEKIKPALKSGKVVLCERFVLSSLAYQGIGRNQNLDHIKAINEYATMGLEPDIVFIFLNKEETLARKLENADRLERAGDDFHNKVRDFYKNLQKKDNYYFIDAWQSIDKVFSDTLEVLDNVGGLK